MLRPPPRPTLFPYTTLFRSRIHKRSRARAEGRRRYRVDTRREAGHNRNLPLERPGSRGCSSRARCGGGRRKLRSEEHTSELQSLAHLVCRLLLEKKKKDKVT